MGGNRGLEDSLFVDVSGSPVSTGFEAATAGGAGGAGGAGSSGEQVGMIGMDMEDFVGPPGRGRGWSSRLDMGGGGGGGGAGRGKLRSPPVALRPGRTARFDSFGGGEGGGGGGSGGVGGGGMGISKHLGGRREEELI